ncbi:hypothetical protein NKH77_15285 [Streptomyces sp. M19]
MLATATLIGAAVALATPAHAADPAPRGASPRLPISIYDGGCSTSSPTGWGSPTATRAPTRKPGMNNGNPGMNPGNPGSTPVWRTA